MLELATIGSLASLLGLVQYNIDKFKSKPKESLYLELLSMLTHFGGAWKSVHSDYHSLISSINPVVEILTEYNRGQRYPIRPNAIAPDTLRRVVFAGSLNAATIVFKNQTRNKIRIISDMKTPEDPSWKECIDTLNKCGLKRVSDNLIGIVEDRDTVIDIHKEFLIFLKAVSTFSGTIDWGLEEVCFFIDNRQLLDIKYHEVIRRTDSVIMQMLDCFEVITTDFERRL